MVNSRRAIGTGPSSMHNKRMFAHDYTRVGFYMITSLCSDTLRAERHCIHDNPRRWVREITAAPA